MKDLGTSSAWPCFKPGLCLGRMYICMFCCEAGCYYRDSALGFQPGLRLKHSLAIWSLGHGEIADNLDENGWKIAVFRPLPPAPSFLFSYSFFHFFPFTSPPQFTLEARNNRLVWLDFFPQSMMYFVNKHVN